MISHLGNSGIAFALDEQGNISLGYSSFTGFQYEHMGDYLVIISPEWIKFKIDNRDEQVYNYRSQYKID